MSCWLLFPAQKRGFCPPPPLFLLGNPIPWHQRASSKAGAFRFPQPSPWPKSESNPAALGQTDPVTAKAAVVFLHVPKWPKSESQIVQLPGEYTMKKVPLSPRKRKPSNSGVTHVSCASMARNAAASPKYRHACQVLCIWHMIHCLARWLSLVCSH